MEVVKDMNDIVYNSLNLYMNFNVNWISQNLNETVYFLFFYLHNFHDYYLLFYIHIHPRYELLFWWHNIFYSINTDMTPIWFGYSRTDWTKLLKLLRKAFVLVCYQYKSNRTWNNFSVTFTNLVDTFRFDSCKKSQKSASQIFVETEWS